MFDRLIQGGIVVGGVVMIFIGFASADLFGIVYATGGCLLGTLGPWTIS